METVTCKHIYKTLKTAEELFPYQCGLYIYDKNEKLCWKAAYTYSGELISLVTAEQDFTCYNLQNEDFVYALYKGHDPTKIRRHMLTVYNAIKQPEQLEIWGITENLLEEYLKEWIPAYHEWLKSHPYSIDWVMEGIIKHYPQYAQNSE